MSAPHLSPAAPLHGINQGAAGSLLSGGGNSLIAGSYKVEDEIAQATGGQAFYSNNDVAEELTDATETGASYYSLSYAPTNQQYDGKLRKIKVELDKKGYKLAYRQAYFGSDTDAPPPLSLNQAHKLKPSTAPPAPRKLGDTLYANMEHGAPIAHQLIFGAHLRTVGAPAMGTPEQMAELATQPAYFKVRHNNKPAKPLTPVKLQRYAIDYTVMAHQLQVEGEPLNLELAVAAYDADGKMLNALVNNGASETATHRPAGAKVLPRGTAVGCAARRCMDSRSRPRRKHRQDWGDGDQAAARAGERIRLSRQDKLGTTACERCGLSQAATRGQRAQLSGCAFANWSLALALTPPHFWRENLA